jgi:hypothetical protein
METAEAAIRVLAGRFDLNRLPGLVTQSEMPLLLETLRSERLQIVNFAGEIQIHEYSPFRGKEWFATVTWQHEESTIPIPAAIRSNLALIQEEAAAFLKSVDFYVASMQYSSDGIEMTFRTSVQPAMSP